tara:strand:- start:212 stop:730 length:519 start_codon:yes stop_codon:yes gene_type:complete
MEFSFMRSLKAYSILLLTGAMLFTIGCEDETADDHDHQEGHTDADGFILKDAAGNEVYREFEGDVTGSVTLAVGETLELSVHFLDHEGNEIAHEEEEEGEDHEDGLVVSENEVSIAIVEVEEHEEGGGDHDDHGMALHVEGVSAGSTSFKLQLMHDGHSDYTSTNNVPVTVN